LIKPPELYPEKTVELGDYLELPKVTLPSVPKNDWLYKMLGYLSLILAISGMTAWAAYAPLESAVIASGTVQVKDKSKQIQHLEGGIVSSIPIREADHVKAGQVLLVLSDLRARTELRSAELQLAGFRAAKARLDAERNGMDQLSFPPQLQAKADTDREIAKLMERQVSLFRSRRDALENEKKILEKMILEQRSRINGMQNRIATTQKRLDSYDTEIQNLRKLFAKKLIDSTRITAMERDRAETEDDLLSYESEIDNSRVKINEAEAKLLQADLEFQRDVETESRDTEQGIAEYANRIASLQDTQQRTLIRSPVEGVVNGLEVTTIGAVVSPGETLMEIVPTNKDYVIDAMVSPTDIDEVHVGLPADIRFGAFNKVDTKIIPGKVVKVSADAFTDPNEKYKYYSAEIRIDDEGIETLTENDLTIIPGMPADVAIKTGERTFLEYVAGPVYEILMKAFREK